MVITAINAFRDVNLKGTFSEPRGKKIKEVLYWRTHVEYPFHNFEFRKRDNLAYIKEEFMWYLRADPYDDSICKHAAIWENIKQPDGRLFSNYGWYWFGGANRDGMSAYTNVLRTLMDDPDSRQAYIPMLGIEHLLKGNKDVVCTKGISFRIKNGKLHMHVDMRSSDLAIGASIDWPCFSFLHQMMASDLRVYVGQFLFSADSLHVYEKDWGYMRAVCDSHGLGQPLILPPPIDDTHDLRDGLYKSAFGKWLTS